MKVTMEQKNSVNQLKQENNFPSDFNWWVKDNDIYLRLNETTVFAVNNSGTVTKHTTKK